MAAVTTLIAEFTTESVILKTPDGKQQKAVSAADFCKALMAQLPSAIEQSGSTWLLPIGTIFTERTVNTFRIAIYVPEHKHTYVLHYFATMLILQFVGMLMAK